MKKSQLRQIFKDLKVETDKETEDEVLDAIKKGKIKNNKEAIKKWLKQNTNQPFTNKIKESIKIKIMSKNDLISIKKALKEWSKITIPFAIHLTIMAIIIYNYAKQ